MESYDDQSREMVMPDIDTLNASEFKAKCLDLLDQVNDGRIGRLVVTKRGKPVAVVTAPPVTEEAVRRFLAGMRGSVIIPEGVDLTEPALDEPMDAELGILHQ